ncbi:MAG: hypothetical protein QOI56_1585 [Actinomycetota bacterium]|nr:hypothetical protein [Actinomycetota bacterium]MEA2932800.1 hypothetical protein [Actinomycetota bacterium]
MTMTKRRRRLVTTGAFLLLPGAAITVGAWVGGEPYLAICLAVFYAVFGVVAYLWSGGGGDVAAIMRVEGDERQRLIDLHATVASFYAVLAFCLGGAVFDLARGGDGQPWGLICAVGGVSYGVALAVIRHRH